MPIWQPDPDETFLSRTPIMFATGAASAVSGMRWFRDTGRNDIQSELPGWPEGPAYAVRSAVSRGARSAGRTAVRSLGAAFLAAITGGGGVGPDIKTLGRPQDPENEVEDFPVMWAAQGTLARTLPWQLDPARRGDGYRTHLVVTDHRAVIVGLRDREYVENDEYLWETDVGNITRVTPKDFSPAQRDFAIDFTDGSWCRLTSNCRADICQYLARPLRLIKLEDLTPGQRERVESFNAGKTSIGDPVITRLPSGNYLIEIRTSEEITVATGAVTTSEVMGPDGGNPVF
ncbi:hypothetical protein [Streptomyces sp. NPDC051776]|uniref:hypothetical protein n=1 Tax=Streptomyces sp. NPDC051776 TaxID=3155414 RepID=UPI003417A2AD